MKTFFRIIFILAIAAAFFYFRAPMEDYFVPPCGTPINYSLGSFDAKFNISKTEFLNALDEATAIWEKPIDKNLFVYSETGALKVNLVYDYRQETTDRLKSLGIVIKDDRSTYDSLKEKYDSFSSAYDQQKTEFNQLMSNYDSKEAVYEQEIKRWNKKGGAPKDVFERLEQERNQLNAMIDQIKQKQSNLNELANNINAIVSDLNQIATKLNLSVENYNYIGGKTGKEFEEGVYQKDEGGERIIIFQFDSKEKLLRVLAHEFGHALSLEHTDNSSDIMYRINEGPNEKLTVNDLAQLKARCGIK